MLSAKFVDAAGLKLEQHAGMIAGDFDRRFAIAVPGELTPCSSADFVVNGGGIAAAHQVAALAAHGLDVDLLVGVAGDELEGGLEDVGVECAGKALVAADDDQQHALLRPGDEERMAQVAGLLVEERDAVGERFEARW